MKTSSSLFALAVSSAALFTSSWARAQEWSFQPRVNVGVMNYEFEQEDLATVTLEPVNLSDGRQITLVHSSLLEGVKRSDNLPYIGIGGTISYDQFFLDLYGLKTATGEQNNLTQYGVDNVTGPIGTISQINRLEADSDIEREEYAIAVGYNLVDNLVLFAGYKTSTTEFDNTVNSFQMTTVGLDGNSVTSLGKGNLKLDLDQKGPFIGAAYGWNIMDKGILSVNAALGFFDGKVKQQTQINFPNNPEQENIINGSFEYSGDVVGLALGVSWRGNITDNLIYSLALSGYNYNYDSNNPRGANFSESVLNFSAGLSYRF